jgi:hypothetical protein
MLDVMATAFQVICALAAVSWICVLVAALAVGCRVVAKLRSKRRRINRLFNVVRLPWRPATRRRSGMAGHYDRALALLADVELDRVIARVVARVQGN